MVSSNIIFMIVGLVLLADSLTVLIFPNWCMKTTRHWFRSKKSMKRVGVIELLISLVILLIGMNI